MKSQLFVPPLRIILTTQCNGCCPFCHNEGSRRNDNMSTKTINECIQSIIDLQIPKITITGGEPTLRQDLNKIIQTLQDKTTTSIGLTTNGFSLSSVGNRLLKPIDNLNLSISSFNDDISMLYQNFLHLIKI